VLPGWPMLHKADQPGLNPRPVNRMFVCIWLYIWLTSLFTVVWLTLATRHLCWNSTGFLFVNGSSTSWPYWHSRSVAHQPQRTSPVTSDRVKLHVVFVPPTRLYCTNLLPELSLLTVLSVALLLQSGVHLAMSLSLALHLLYLRLPLRHSYSVRHIGLVIS